MRPLFLVLVLAGCRVEPVVSSPAAPTPVLACDEMLSPVAPDPAAPSLTTAAWLDDSTIVASIAEGDVAARSCGLGEEPQRNGLIVHHVGETKPTAAFRGLRVTQLETVDRSTAMVVGPRFGVGTVDLETGCFRRTGRATLAEAAIDQKRRRFYLANLHLEVWDATTLLRVQSVDLGHGARALVYDPHTDTIVALLLKDTYDLRELAVFEATTLKKVGSLVVSASLGERLVVRPKHGEVDLVYDAPCLKWANEKKGGLRCIEGGEHGLLGFSTAPLAELGRTIVERTAGTWSPSGESWLTEPHATLGPLAFAGDTQRYVGQPSTFTLGIFVAGKPDSFAELPLPRGEPSSTPACGPGK